MVQITIDLDSKLNIAIQKYMIDNPDKCLNENGNVDKRKAIINLLQKVKSYR